MFYFLLRFVCLVGSRIYIFVKKNGAKNIPKKGNFIICSNHIHSWDPAVIAVSTRRTLRFMARKELLSNKFKSVFWRLMGAFPVDRSRADMSAYRNAIKVLNEGYGLVIFAQGTRMKEVDAKSAKGGVALFAHKSRAPIIPCGISGVYEPFSTISVNFGKPILLNEYYDKRLSSVDVDKIMFEVMSEVERLTKL